MSLHLAQLRGFYHDSDTLGTVIIEQTVDVDDAIKGLFVALAACENTMSSYSGFAVCLVPWKAIE